MGSFAKAFLSDFYSHEGALFMADTTKGDKGLAPPKQGEKYRCAGCGMELEITKDCQCKAGEHVHFHCCGIEMVKA